MAIKNLRRYNENLAKRSPTVANMKVTAVLPGGINVPAGSHTVGFIEGDVVITRVTSVVADGFNGSAPLVSLTDSDGLTYFNDRNLLVVGSVGSPLTNPDGTARLTPIYKAGKTEFTIDITPDGATKGEVDFVIEYTQLDTTNGMHQGGRY
jgi:hypothetical protein